MLRLMEVVRQVIIFCIIFVSFAICAKVEECTNGTSMLDAKLSALRISKEEHNEFQKFKSEFNRKYTNDIEETIKLMTFAKNLRKINNHNRKFESGESTFKMAVNDFADLEEEEFLATRTGYIPSPQAIHNDMEEIIIKSIKPPPFIDWSRSPKLSQEVRDQGPCSASWAYALIDAIESEILRETENPVQLSVQYLIDCDKKNFGCEGGSIDSGLEFINAHELVNKSYYDAYWEEVDRDKVCKIVSHKLDPQKDRFVKFPVQNEFELMNTISFGGVALMEIGKDIVRNFQFYSDGIINSCENGSLTHAVIIVGYGSKGSTDYWLIRNSYGIKWGQNGYGLIKRNVNSCGISKFVSYPIIKKKRN